MRILIAEDDGVSRRVLESVLQKWGHEVSAVADGDAAWRLLQRDDAPSLVILDGMMPGLDGVDVCQMLRGIRREVRPYVILLTGRGQKGDVVKGITAGADDYVVKPFDPEELRVRILAGERIINLEIESAAVMQALRKSASRDALTGLPNRETILEMLTREFSRPARTGTSVAVVMADVDHFKNINDTYGHQAGDFVLAEVAMRMATAMRSYEHLGRYGGEEFLGIMCDCDLDGCTAMAERLRRAVAEKAFEIGPDRLPVTASFGVASTAGLSFPTPQLLIALADAALYQAKRTGRNRVQTAPDLPQPAHSR